MNESPSYFEDILNEIRAGISILDKDLTIIKTSKWMEEVYSRNFPLVGKKCYEAYHDRDEHCEICPTLTSINTKKKCMEIVPIVYNDGSNGWLELTSIPKINDKGEVYQIIEYIKDISDIFQTSKKLEETKNTLEMVMHSSKTGVYDWNIETNDVDVDQEILNQVNYSKEEANMEMWISLIHPDDIARVKNSMENIVTGKSEYFEEIYRLRNKDGLYKWIISTGKIIEKLKDERPKRIIGTQRDITEFIEAKEKIEKSEHKYRLLFDSSPIAIFVTDIIGNIMDLNPIARKLIGIKNNSDVIGTQLFNLMDDVDLNRAKDNMEKVVKHGMLNDQSYRITTNQGNKISLKVSASLLKDKENNPTGFVVFAQDVTEEDKIQQALLQTQKLENMGVLAGGIAHDFNNLMLVIIGNADLAELEIKDNSEIKEFIQEIKKGAYNASELSRQMLAYAGKGEFEKEMIDLSKLITEIVSLIKMSISDKIELKLSLNTNIPEIYGDKSQIRQIVMNLLTNASESLENRPGEVRISTGIQFCDKDYFKMTYLTNQLPEGQYVFLEVTDSGIGMNKDTINKIFDPFFTTKFTGRGLGLAAVLGVIKSHNGAIKVYSEIGKGSIFKVLFPITREGSKTGKIQLNKSNTNNSEKINEDLAVLIVDDDPIIVKTATKMLESYGVECFSATNGLEAIEFLEESNEDIDIIILDLIMPVLDGNDAFKEIRKRFPLIKVILSSGFSDKEVSENLKKLDFEFLQKPYSRKELRNKLLKSIQIKENL
jgi:two-component system cell cycle sensor histidine kinase/response regulator CckA